MAHLRVERGGSALLVALLTSLCVAAAPRVAVAQGGGSSEDARCAALAAVPLDGVAIDSARVARGQPGQAGGAAPGTAGGVLPPHCLVKGAINKRIGANGRAYAIGFELRLPDTWNGRFLFQGGAGLDGVVAPAVGTIPNSAQQPALARGFAVVSTDAGHSGSPVDASFAVDQQARIDYGYNALDKVTLAAKALLGRYYGKPADRSYFVGCSNGGRQALTAAQRLPLYFDGIVAGDPTIRFSRVTLDQVWNLRTLAAIAPRDTEGRPVYSRAFSDADLKLVRAAVLKRCDARDGLTDGMINDWQGCDFTPAQLQCRKGGPGQCLTTAKVRVLDELHRGPRAGDGKPLYGAFNYDTGIASSTWRGMRLGTSDTGVPNAADATLGLGAFRTLQLTPPDPGFDPLTGMDLEALVERTRHTAALTDADSPFLSSFAARGKMIVYNGLADQGLASSVLADWYDRMAQATGPAGQAAVRLFLVPGMLHCGGGEATDRFEMLDAIVDWVEHERAPGRIVATSSQTPGLTRPLCPYPTIARYTGGDTRSEQSFACVPRPKAGRG